MARRPKRARGQPKVPKVTWPCFANPQKTKIRSRIGAFLFNSDLIMTACEASYFAFWAIRKTKQRLQRVRPNTAAQVSEETINTARRILMLRDEHSGAINAGMGTSAGSGLRLLDYLYQQPMINIRMVERRLGISFVTAGKLVERFVTLGILTEATGGERNRRYSYTPYLALFESSATHGLD